MRIRKERYSDERYYVNIFLIAMVILIIVGVIIGVSYSNSKSNDSNPCDSGSNSGVSGYTPGVSMPNCKFINDKNKKFKDEDKIIALGDGNCFFHAVLYGLKCLNLYNGDHKQLRSDLCDSMLTNQFSRTYIMNNFVIWQIVRSNYTNDDEDIEINEYVNGENGMRKDGAWGTEIELYCIGRMFEGKCYFQCYDLPPGDTFLRKVEILKIPGPPDLPIINIYNMNMEFHYDSLPTYRPLSSSS